MFRDLMPWLAREVAEFSRRKQKEMVVEKETVFEGNHHAFRVKISQLLDVSYKFAGTLLILEGITSLKDAWETVKTLEGFIPICSHCKRMRDDDGYWSQLEEYLEKRSGALFTHGIGDECLKKYYSDII